MPLWTSNFTYKSRWWLLPLILLSVYLLSLGKDQLGFKSDYRAYLSADNPQLQALESMQGKYDKSDNLMIVLATKDGKELNRHDLSTVENVTKKAWGTPYSVRVESLSNFQHIEADADNITVRNLIDGDWTANGVISTALNQPQLVGRLISKSGDVAAINVTYHLPGISPFENYEIVQFARNLASEVRKDSDLEVHLTGMAMYNNAFFESAIADAKSLTPIVYAVIAIAGLLLLRSIFATTIAIASVYLGVIAAEGAAGWLGMSLTSLSSSAPLIILTIGTADAVHVLMSILKRLRSGEPKELAIRNGVNATFWPVIISSLATMIAFLSLNFSEIPPFHDLGNMVSIGILIACLFSLFALPGICTFIPWKVTKHGDRLEVVFMKFGQWIGIRSIKMLLIFLPVAIVIAMFSFKNELNDQYLSWFDEKMSFRVANDFTQKNLTGLYTVEYSLTSQSPDGISSPAALQDVEAFTKWLREQNEVMHVSSLSDTIKRINQTLNNGNPDYYKIPDSTNMAAQSLLLYEQSLPYGLDLNNQIDVNRKSTRIVVALKELTTEEMLNFEATSISWLNENSNITTSSAASTTLIFAHIGQRNIESMITGISITAILVSLLLMVTFGSWKLGLVAIIPNILPAAMAYGIWGITVGQAGFSLAIVTAITFGIVVDNTIHFLYHYSKHSKNQNNFCDKITSTFSETGPAIFVTSTALIVGFAVLGTSTFELNKEMGLATSITLLLAIITDFLVLPGLLNKLEEKTNESNENNELPAAA